MNFPMQKTAAPAPGAFRVLDADAVRVSHTGNTNETTLVTVAIPPMGPDDMLRVTMQGGGTGSGNKTHRIKLGGTTFLSVTQTTNLTQAYLRHIRNRGATNSQISEWLSANGPGTSSSAAVTGSEETNAGINLTITGQLATGGEEIAVEAYTVELLQR